MFNRNGERKFDRREVSLQSLLDTEANGGEEVLGYFSPVKASRSGVNTVETSIKEAAKDIFTGASNLRLSDISVKDDRREKVSSALTKLKDEAIKKAKTSDQPGEAIIGAMRASAGGKPTGDTFNQSFEKLSSTINQVDLLNTALNKKKIKGKNLNNKIIDLSPLTGFLKTKNPWSLKGQTIKAALQGTIPNMARGVFGEVGVLTDRDIELYRKTLPNLSQPEDIRRSITALTMRTLRNSLDKKIGIAAGTERDVSGLVPFNEQMDTQVKKLEKELGIIPTEDDYLDTVVEPQTDEVDDYISSLNLN